MSHSSTRQWRGYRLIREIGSGGMGTVFEARRTFALRQERACAIKLLHRHLLHDADAFTALAREGLIGWEHCHHPNLLAFYDFGIWPDGRPFLVTEYVHGPDLIVASRWLRGDYVLIGRIAIDAIEALFHLRARGIVHRDISPQNILMSANGSIKLADLGLARSTTDPHLGTLCGVPPYVAPEILLHGSMATEATDLYALGAVLYELVTGRPPYGSGPWGDIAARMRTRTPEPLPAGVPTGLAQLVTALLADRADRPSLPEAAAMLARSDGPIASPSVVAAFVTAWNDLEAEKRSERSPTLEHIPLRQAVLEHLDQLAAGKNPQDPGSMAESRPAPGPDGQPPAPGVPRVPGVHVQPPGARRPWLVTAAVAVVLALTLGYGLGERRGNQPSKATAVTEADAVTEAIPIPQASSSARVANPAGEPTSPDRVENVDRHSLVATRVEGDPQARPMPITQRKASQPRSRSRARPPSPRPRHHPASDVESIEMGHFLIQSPVEHVTPCR